MKELEEYIVFNKRIECGTIADYIDQAENIADERGLPVLVRYFDDREYLVFPAKKKKG